MRWNLPPLSTRLHQAAEHVADVGANALELPVGLAPRVEQVVVPKPMLRKAVLSPIHIQTVQRRFEQYQAMIGQNKHTSPVEIGMSGNS